MLRYHCLCVFCCTRLMEWNIVTFFFCASPPTKYFHHASSGMKFGKERKEEKQKSYNRIRVKRYTKRAMHIKNGTTGEDCDSNDFCINFNWVHLWKYEKQPTGKWNYTSNSSSTNYDYQRRLSNNNRKKRCNIKDTHTHSDIMRQMGK